MTALGVKFDRKGCRGAAIAAVALMLGIFRQAATHDPLSE